MCRSGLNFVWSRALEEMQPYQQDKQCDLLVVKLAYCSVVWFNIQWQEPFPVAMPFLAGVLLIKWTPGDHSASSVSYCNIELVSKRP